MDDGWWFYLGIAIALAITIGKEIYLHRKYGDGPRPKKKKDPLKQAKDLAVLLFLIFVLIIVLCVCCEQT